MSFNLMAAVTSCSDFGAQKNNFGYDLSFFPYLLPSRIPQRRQWHPILVLLPGKSHGQRSLVGCSPWGREESEATERLHFSLSRIGEGNGNPLQYSCLENPRDVGAWWAAVYGVTQSRTRLKWLSSSSSRKQRKTLKKMCFTQNYLQNYIILIS